jgi:Acetyltransferase (GNAT) domain
MEIKYIPYNEIDKLKWDNCIINATNSLIYAHSFYLDNCTAKKWDALVLNDYEAVMPITFRKKYGIAYLYQPYFLQQAGLFSSKKIDERLVNIFLAEIEKRFQFAEINLNYANILSSNKKIKYIERNNFILSLNNTYKNISKKFNSNFVRNIKQASKHGFNYEKVKSADELVDLYKKLYGARFEFVKKSDYDALKINCKTLLTNNNLVLRKASINGKIHAVIILLKDAKRLYNIAPSVTEEGRKLSANHFLYNSVIEEFAEQNLILDFEGSDLKGVANFYQSMNPINEKYISIKYNNLPKLIKLFKK